MATRAGRVVTMCGKPLPDRLVLVAGIFIERWHIVGWRGGRIVEDHFDNPDAASDRMGPFRSRGHAEHRRVGDDAAVATVINLDSAEFT